MKAGIVALIGRPNTGKSTLLNNILGRKVAITSPKPQTTQFPIQAVFEDERGQIIFVDTPGIYEKSTDALSKRINLSTKEALSLNIDLVLYFVDHTRTREVEENRVLGIIRKMDVPKILVFNKSDIKSPSYKAQYLFIQEECNETIEISALFRKNLNVLMDTIFSYLPERESIVNTESLIQPGLNIDSKLFISELIREKAFLFLRRELPYTLTVVTDLVEERENGTLYIQARILTGNDKYKKMIIGQNGSMIKEIGMAVRKEMETSRNGKVYVELTVETDPHWMEYLN